MSQINPIFKAIVEDGKLSLKNKDKFNNYLSHLKGEVEIIIRRRKRLRSTQENNYYWGVVVEIISKEMGLNKQETHEFLKHRFLTKEILVKGKMYEVTKSTTDLSTVEMEEYLETIRRWVIEDLKAIIPLPNEVEVNE